MSLPGLGLAEPEAPQVIETTEHDLTKGSEWRFEVAFGKHISVKVCLSFLFASFAAKSPLPSKSSFHLRSKNSTFSCSH